MAPSGCWEWVAAKDEHGYGIMNNGYSRQVRGHQVSYRIFIGPTIKGLVVMHVCQNAGCVNPAHLKLTTHKENISYDAATRPKKDRCIHGHKFRISSSGSTKYCPICKAMATRKYCLKYPEKVKHARHDRYILLGK